MSLSLRTAKTEYHRQQTLSTGGLNNRCLFLMVLEAGKFKIKSPAGSVLGEHPLPGSQTVPSHHILKWQKRGKAACRNFFYTGILPVHEGSIFMT